MTIIFYLISSIIFLFINYYLKKNKILLNYTGEKHQAFIETKNVTLSLGSFFLVLMFFSLKSIYEINFLFFLFLFYLFGLLTDIKFFKSPKIRFVFQILLVFSFIFFNDLKISSLRFPEIDELLNNEIINIFFVSVCFLVLINGSNFIDGLNGLLILFYLIILFVLYFLNLIPFDNLIVYQFFYVFTFCLILNLLNLAFLGDNGVYIISIFFGHLILTSYQSNPSVSPYFYSLLLFYPAFETLFSILRKFKFNKSPIMPDNNHLHQLFYSFLKNNFKFNNLKSNNISSIIINLINLLFILFGSVDVTNSKLQITCIIIYIIFYSSFYFRLFVLKYEKKF